MYRGDVLEFGHFRLDPEQQILWRDGQALPLGPRVVSTLCVLVARRGQVVSREELIRQVWGETTVEYSSLAHNIFVLRKTLKEEDASCSFTIETLPRRGYRFCETSTTEPPEAAEHNVSGLESAAAVTTDTFPNFGGLESTRLTTNAPQSQWLTLVIGLAVLTCLGVVLGVHFARVSGAEKSRDRRSVAVVGFANMSQHPDSEWLSAALTEMITTELAAGGRLLTTPDESVARARTELRLQNRDGFSRETLGRLRQSLNADLIVSGAYTVLPNTVALSNKSQSADNQIQLDLRIQDATTGTSIDSVSETGEQSRLFELVARVVAKVRQDMGLEVIAPEDAEEARWSVSSNPEVVRLYVNGVEKLRNFNALGARDLLQQAVAADPDYALAYSALAETWMALGYDQRAAQSAQRAYLLSGKLGLEQKLLIEGRYRETARQWSEAIAAYRILFDAYPDNVEYGLRLTRAERLGSQYHNALSTLQALRKLPAPSSNDPRIDLEECMAALSSGDLTSAQRAASAGEQKGWQRGSALLVAQAKLLKPISTFSPASPTLIAEQEEVRRICESLGDMDCVGQAWLRTGIAQNPRQASKAALEQALVTFSKVGDERRVGEAQRRLGILYMDQGKLFEARREYSRARATCEKIEDRSCIAKVALDNGNIDFISGDVAAAESNFRQALGLARNAGEEQLVSGSLNNLASLLAEFKGKLAEAEAIYRELIEINRRNGREEQVSLALSNLARVRAEQGYLTEARRILTEAQERASKDGGPPDLVCNALNLGEIDLAEGHPADAEARLRRKAKTLEDQKDSHVVNYYDDIAAAQLAQNKPADAQRTVAHARELLGGVKKGFDSYHLAITEAKVAAALRPEDAHAGARSVASLREVIAQCRESKSLGLEFQARLAEGEIEMKSGAFEAGRAHLASLEHDANAKGFGLIARQASTARQVTLAQQR